MGKGRGGPDDVGAAEKVLWPLHQGFEGDFFVGGPVDGFYGGVGGHVGGGPGNLDARDVLAQRRQDAGLYVGIFVVYDGVHGGFKAEGLSALF
jgi:hypothetical protein